MGVSEASNRALINKLGVVLIFREPYRTPTYSIAFSVIDALQLPSAVVFCLGYLSIRLQVFLLAVRHGHVSFPYETAASSAGSSNIAWSLEN